MDQPLFYLLAAFNLISLAHLGMYILGANTYDILQFKKARTKKSRPASSYHPLVSVVIPAHNEALVISRTLDSVRASSYRRIEVIVVDDGSNDHTDQIVKDYIAGLPTMRTSFYTSKVARRDFDGKLAFRRRRRYLRVPELRIRTVRVVQRNGGKATAMNNGIINYAQGELVMCLDADSILHRDAVKNAVEYFRDPKVIGVAANVRVLDNGTWLARLQRFEHMIGYRAKKFYSLINSEFIIGGVASTYRMSALKAVDFYDDDTQTEDIGLSMKMIAMLGNKNARIVYAADVVAMTEGVQEFAQLLRQRYRWKLGCLQNLFKFRQLIGRGQTGQQSFLLTKYRLPMAVVSEIMLVLEPLIIAYIVYLSIAYHTFGIVIGAYMTVTGYVLLTLWPDEHLSGREKVRLSMTACYMYGLFYVMDVVQVAAIFRCLLGYHKITERGSATWVSPSRSGEAMTF